MKKFIPISVFLLLLIPFTGCVPLLVGAGVGSSTSFNSSVFEATQKNRDNLKKIVYGLSEKTVLEIMGTKSVRATIGEESIYIPNPYRIDRMRGINDVKLEVVYYVTNVKDNSFVFLDDELTPLVFRYGKLAGWGWPYLNSYTRKYKLRKY